MSTVIIALNGEVRSPKQTLFVLSQIVIDKEKPFIIGVDGGCSHLERLGLEPNRMVGDFDSTKDLESLKRKWPKALFEKYPSEKDYTDAELAIEFALKEAPERIVFIGAFGGRMDHFLGNVMLMRKIPESVEAYALDENNWMQWVRGPFEKSYTQKELNYKYLSLVPLIKAFEGITLMGFKYPLKDATIEVGDSLGISNEIESETARVKILRGEGLVIRSNDRKKS